MGADPSHPLKWIDYTQVRVTTLASRGGLIHNCGFILISSPPARQDLLTIYKMNCLQFHMSSLPDEATGWEKSAIPQFLFLNPTTLCRGKQAQA